ncbi:MAG TPA: threonine/serine dehydratase [Streptosporangiaceae bacterium]|nr:threonine/serine dehydratase [Streptosporangiaceae bacterium]
MPELVTATEIAAAADRIAGVVVRTPLVSFPGRPLLIKPESLQPTGSFKLRGAYAVISALDEEARSRGVIAHSSGNHAGAVGYAAARLGVRAVLVIPSNAPEVKLAKVRATGAEIVTVEPGLDARVAATDELIARHGYSFVPPFDHRGTIAGQGTIGLEILDDSRDVDLVVVPVSGGGLISGIAAAIKAARPDVKIVGAEPELAADARDSLRAGHRVAWTSEQTQRTIADALRIEQVGELAFEHIRRLVDDIVTVTEEEIRITMRRLALEGRLIAEPGGAVAVAACLLREHELPPASAPVAVLSGGNVDPALLTAILTGTAVDPAA